jgi:phosphoglycolate phosphatase-like HAD superfamily hydrolase
MRFRSTIFDLDGTIINSLGVVMRAYQYALSTVSQEEFSEEYIARHFGPNEEGVLRTLVPEAWPKATEAYHRYESEHVDEIVLFNGIIEVLDFLLSKEVSMALVTGRGQQSASFIMDEFSLERYFAIISAGTPETTEKTAELKRVIKHLHIDPQEAVFIGDATTDALSAISAEITPVLAKWSPLRFSPTAREPNVLTFYRVNDLYSWLQEVV